MYVPRTFHRGAVNISLVLHTLLLVRFIIQYNFTGDGPVCYTFFLANNKQGHYFLLIGICPTVLVKFNSLEKYLFNVNVVIPRLVYSNRCYGFFHPKILIKNNNKYEMKNNMNRFALNALIRMHSA